MFVWLHESLTIIMFFNPRSLVATALVSFYALEASALDFKPITDPSQLIKPGQTFKRDAAPAPVDLLPIDDPTVLTHGRSLRRAVTGKEAFDPSSETNFFWGAYGKFYVFCSSTISLTGAQLATTSTLQTSPSRTLATMSSSCPLKGSLKNSSPSSAGLQDSP